MEFIPLTNSSKTATVSDADYEHVKQHRWFLKHNGKGGYYVARSVRCGNTIRTILLHRFVLQPPDGYDIHHKNGNKLDCTRENLESIEHSLHGREFYGPYAKKWNEAIR